MKALQTKLVTIARMMRREKKRGRNDQHQGITVETTDTATSRQILQTDQQAGYHRQALRTDTPDSSDTMNNLMAMM